MHGGTARGPITKAGKRRSRLASLKHGGHTKEAQSIHREAMHLIRCSKECLKKFD